MKTEWRTIESAPKDGTRILIARRGDKVGMDEIEITEWFVIEQSHFEHIEGNLYRKVQDDPYMAWNDNGHRATHWMPLPKPPEETS